MTTANAHAKRIPNETTVTVLRRGGWAVFEHDCFGFNAGTFQQYVCVYVNWITQEY